MSIKVGIVVLFFVSCCALAQPAPTVSGVTPVYLRQGDAQELTVNGANLGGATGVVLTDAKGLGAELVGAAQATQVKIKLTSSAETALGVREMRVVTPLGVTAPVLVTVGQFPVTVDVEAGEQATLSFPTSIVGKIEAGGDVDSFRFEAKKGQRMVFDVHAARLGSVLDPVVIVLDANGREQARNVSFEGGDPVVVFDVPRDGAYSLAIRDIQHRGGGDYVYRIDAGPIPYVESIVPASGRRGTKVSVRAVGHNLGDDAVMTVDLSNAPAGVTPLRFKTAAGLSNEVAFAVTDVGEVAEKAPNDSVKTAAAVSLPAEVSGVLAKAREEDFYRFSVPTKQNITIDAIARRFGSPVDALLTLRDAKGAVLAQTNGEGGSEARISRAFDPGDYVVSIRDLSYGGGSSYSYRISLIPGNAPADFAVRFVPDAPRIARGGHTKVWCEIVRMNGYKGDVAVSVEGLPAGVSVSGGVASIGEVTSGIFTLSASEDAQLGTTPIRLKAVGTFGAQTTERYGEAELGTRVVRGAYLTVLERPPFTVESLASVRPEQLTAYPAEAQKIFARLNAPATPELEKAQAEWEKKIGTQVDDWKRIEVTSAASAGGVPLNKQSDGSLLAAADKSADKDTYTVVGAVSVKQIAAVRLEALPDGSIAANGPGRSGGGNFVLNRFTVTVAPKSDPTKATAIAFKSAKASFEQPNYPVANAIGNGMGWAISGGTGKAQSARFFPEKPIPAGDVILTVTLDQQFGTQHTLGRFRLSVAENADAKEMVGDSVPTNIAAILKVPADKRDAAQKTALAAYYRTIDPKMRADAARLEALRNTIGPLAEIARLEAALVVPNPALDAERKEWEQSVAAGISWTPIEVTSVRAANGTVLVKDKDDSVTASGPAPATDVYTIAGKASQRVISAIKLEALPDDRFAASGPGRAGGNFVLTKFAANAETKPVAFKEARATFEQKDFGIAGALDENAETGWAISPLVGMAHSATFVPRVPIVGSDAGANLSVTLEFNSPKYGGFTIGRFRLWVLGSQDGAAANIPAEIIAILKIAEEKRNEEQKAELAAYYRTISPALEPTRQRLAELKRNAPPATLTVGRNKSATIPVPVNRLAEFAGPVQVTLEGFSAGREPKGGPPAPLAKNIDVTPLSVDPAGGFGKLTIKPKPNCEVGTRMVVLKAETKIGNDTFVAYSPAFAITVTEK